MKRLLCRIVCLASLVAIYLEGGSTVKAQDPRIEKMLQSWNSRYEFMPGYSMSCNEVPTVNSPDGSFLVEYPSQSGRTVKLLVAGSVGTWNGEVAVLSAVVEALPAGTSPEEVIRRVREEAGLLSGITKIGNIEECLFAMQILRPGRPTDCRIELDDIAVRLSNTLRPVPRNAGHTQAPSHSQTKTRTLLTESESPSKTKGRTSLERMTAGELEIERKLVLDSIGILDRSAEDFDRQFQRSIRDDSGVPSSLSAAFSTSAHIEKQAKLARLREIDRRLASLK